MSQKEVSVTRHAEPVVADAVQQDHRVAVCMFWLEVPPPQLDSVGRINGYVGQRRMLVSHTEYLPRFIGSSKLPSNRMNRTFRHINPSSQTE